MKFPIKNRKMNGNIEIDFNWDYDKIRIELMKYYVKDLISLKEISNIYIWLVRYNHKQKDLLFDKYFNIENIYIEPIKLSDDKQTKRLF